MARPFRPDPAPQDVASGDVLPGDGVSAVQSRVKTVHIVWQMGAACLDVDHARSWI